MDTKRRLKEAIDGLNAARKEVKRLTREAAKESQRTRRNNRELSTRPRQ